MSCSNPMILYCLQVVSIRTQATREKDCVFLFLVPVLSECLTHGKAEAMSVQCRDQYDNLCKKKKSDCDGCQNEDILNFGRDNAWAEQAFLEGKTLKSILKE